MASACLRHICHASGASSVGSSFSDGVTKNMSLSEWDVCRGRRNVSFWLEFLADFYSRYHLEKNRLLKKEIVNEAVSKWIAAGGRFLSTSSDGFCVLSDSADQFSVAAYYFRNYRSMGLLRRTKSPAPPSGKSLSAGKSPLVRVASPSPPLVSQKPTPVDVVAPSVVATTDLSAPTTDLSAPAAADDFGAPSAPKRVRPSLTKSVVKTAFTTKSKLVFKRVLREKRTEKRTEQKRKRDGNEQQRDGNVMARDGNIMAYLRRTSTRLRRQRSVPNVTHSNKSVSINKSSNRRSVKSGKRKRTNATTGSCNVSDGSGDIWHPQKRSPGAELLPVYRERLSNAGIQHWYEYAANLFSHYEETKAKVSRLAKRQVKPHVQRQAIKKQLRLHRHVSAVRRRYDTERDQWGSWLLDGEYRGFSSIWTMQLTLSASDIVVKPIVEHLIKNLHFRGPVSVLEAISASENSYEESVACLASQISTCINYRKASAIIALAVICVLTGKIPNSYEEIVSVPWVGPKCAYEALKEGFGCLDAGVGCDIHMCRMFGVLGWSDPVSYYEEFDKKKQKIVTRERYNHDRTSAQIMSWLPKAHWREMNHIYAGLGQLLQKSDPSIRSKIRKDLLNVPEKWMHAKLSAMLSLPQYS